MESSTGTPSCDFCGAVPPCASPGASPGAPLPLTWTTAVEDGRRRVFCATCSREHLRAIEGKLDSGWWSRVSPR